MNTETIKKLVMCGTELHDWQVDIADSVIDILDAKGGLGVSEICCAAYHHDADGINDGLDNAIKFVDDVRAVLATLLAGGAIDTDDSRYWIIGRKPIIKL